MSFRQSISRFRKKVKGKVSNIGNKIKQGTRIGGEGLDHSSLSFQSEPATTVEGELRGDTGVGIGNEDPRANDYLPVSRSMVELEREQGESDDDAAPRERSQKGLHSHAYERAGHGSGST